MKKLLIATTALVATAGMAAADVKLTGSAEIGMTDGGGATGMEMHTDMDIDFKLSGATDNGLSFGATIDLDQVSGGINSTGGKQAIHVSGDFGTLTMGETDGAMDKRNNEVGSLTAISDNHTGHAGYNGGSGLDSGDILRYDTSIGTFNVSASIGQDDTAGNNDVMGYGLSTTVGTVALSVGYQTDDNQDITAVSAKSTVGGLTMTANYSEATMKDSAAITGVSASIVAATSTAVAYNILAVTAKDAVKNSYEHTGLGLGYSVSGVNLSANYGSYDYDDGSTADGFGVAANYSLGGGATVMVGYGSGNARATNRVAAAADVDSFSVGLGLSF